MFEIDRPPVVTSNCAMNRPSVEIAMVKINVIYIFLSIFFMKLMIQKTVSDINLRNTYISLLKIYSVDREMMRLHIYVKNIYF